jgi:hypothetical protein
MGWTNFLDMSKRYMGYGEAISKKVFWLKFPRAAIRFYYFQFIRWIKEKKGSKN